MSLTPNQAWVLALLRGLPIVYLPDFLMCYQVADMSDILSIHSCYPPTRNLLNLLIAYQPTTNQRSWSIVALCDPKVFMRPYCRWYTDILGWPTHFIGSFSLVRSTTPSRMSTTNSLRYNCLILWINKRWVDCTIRPMWVSVVEVVPPLWSNVFFISSRLSCLFPGLMTNSATQLEWSITTKRFLFIRTERIDMKNWYRYLILWRSFARPLLRMRVCKVR